MFTTTKLTKFYIPFHIGHSAARGTRLTYLVARSPQFKVIVTGRMQRQPAHALVKPRCVRFVAETGMKTIRNLGLCRGRACGQ